MKAYEKAWEDIEQEYNRLGLKENPFSESADISSEERINAIFTGRHVELREVLRLFKGESRKRILIYGWYGIGKTIFMKIVLDAIKYKFKKSLVSYISMPAETDIATTALIALALEMPNDEWALQQLNMMGIMPDRGLYKRKNKIEFNAFGVKGGKEEETIPFKGIKYPSISFDKLCERALKKHDKIVIGIDDLDKQDPDRVTRLLRDAQGLLKGKAWFILSGHPGGLTKDMVTGNLGLFDLTRELTQMDENTTHEMLVKYLNVARSEPSEHIGTTHPFNEEQAKLLYKNSEGHPRWFNRLAFYILSEALDRKASRIDANIFEKGRERTRKELQNQQELSDNDLYLFKLIEERGSFSDENISMDDLNKFGIKTFNDMMPMLEKLVQHDLLRQIERVDGLKYVVTPIMK